MQSGEHHLLLASRFGRFEIAGDRTVDSDQRKVYQILVDQYQEDEMNYLLQSKKLSKEESRQSLIGLFTSKSKNENFSQIEEFDLEEIESRIYNKINAVSGRPSEFRPTAGEMNFNARGLTRVFFVTWIGKAEAKRGANPEASRSNITRYRPGSAPSPAVCLQLLSVRTLCE